MVVNRFLRFIKITSAHALEQVHGPVKGAGREEGIAKGPNFPWSLGRGVQLLLPEAARSLPQLLFPCLHV